MSNSSTNIELKEVEVKETISEETKEKENAEEIEVVDRTDREKYMEYLKKQAKIPYFSLWRYAETSEKLLLMVAIIASLAQGTGYPLFSILMGDFIDQFFKPGVADISLMFTYMGIGMFVVSYLSQSLFDNIAEKQIFKIRGKYIQALLTQDIKFFDKKTTTAGLLSARLATDTEDIRIGMGSQIGNMLNGTSMFISGLIIGFVRGWQLSLVILSALPAMGIAMFFMVYFMESFKAEGNAFYEMAGSFADETLRSIRNVLSFTAQEMEMKRYEKGLELSRSKAIKGSIGMGFSFGLIMFIMWSMYGLAFWYGAKLINDKEISPITDLPYTPGDILTVFFAILMGTGIMANVGTATPYFLAASVGGHRIFQIINSIPEVNSMSNEGQVLDDVTKADIIFEDVHFSYVNREDSPVFQGLNLHIKAGQTTAIVGESGCGKSTVIALLERFYEPTQGRITYGGVDIRELNINWYRKQIGLVSQEPILFNGTILENIRFGNNQSTDEECINAANVSNAHSFISSLPDQYQTSISSAQLSGGQKQMVAISRAIISEPKILLLDEATSALDNESELLVQQSLDLVAHNQTSIVVAHRLSTIRSADHIIVLDNGKVMEQGNHDQLMKINGIYTALTKAQEGVNFIPSKNISKNHHEEVKVFEKKEIEALTKVTDTTEVELKKYKPVVPLLTVLALLKPDIYLFIVDILLGVVSGSIMPVNAIILSDFLISFGGSGDIMEDASKNAIYFVILGVVSFFIYIIRFITSGHLSENLSYRLRRSLYHHFLRQSLEFHDQKENSPQLLAIKLSNDANIIKNATNVRITQLIEAVSMMAAGLGIALYYGWLLSLCILAVAPVMLIGGYLQNDMGQFVAKSGIEAFEKAGAIAGETLSNIKTVHSFGAQKHILNKFNEELASILNGATKQAHVSGLTFGLSNFIIFGIYGYAFYLGAKFVEDGDIDFGQMMKVLFAIMTGFMQAGGTFQFAGDYFKSRKAADSYFKLMEMIPHIDALGTTGSTEPIKESSVEFDNTRPDIPIFDGLSFTIQPGEVVGVVGSTGSGKSTIVTLLQRLYEVNAGSIRINNTDIRDYNVEYLRNSISIVSQEPTLFNGTINEAIKYGKPSASNEEVIAVAKIANIHDVIMGWEKGYDTQVGSLGSQLSGGQKQRVAIARALLKNPTFLLLDEATSALDTQSEQQVQAELEKIIHEQKRTTLIIAHRLSTVRFVDKIIVLNKGKLVECGSHEELMKLDGFYANLVNIGSRT